MYFTIKPMIVLYSASVDYVSVLTTYYLLPGQDPVVVIRIKIIDDSIQEGDEQFNMIYLLF